MKNNTMKAFALGMLLVASLPGFAATESTLSEKGSEIAADASQLANKAATLVKDSAITAYIYAQIALDKNLSKLGINVSTEKGVVTLAGKVKASSQAEALIDLASSATGVSSVDSSKLIVEKSQQPFADIYITAKVKSVLIRDKLTDELAMPVVVHVETKNGVVYLSGTSSNAIQTDNAIKVAQSIAGVQGVESSIKLVTGSSK